MIQQILLVGLGGFIGAASRFGVGRLFASYYTSSFPWATLFVNAMGCFAIGFYIQAVKNSPTFPSRDLFFVVGFLGSFTTFSAFGFETIQLIKTNHMLLGLLNIFGNMLLCLIAVYVGIHLASK